MTQFQRQDEDSQLVAVVGFIAHHPHLRYSDFRLLAGIIEAGDSGLEQKTIREQNDRYGSFMAATQGLQRLEAAGLVYRQQVPSSRRMVYFRSTEPLGADTPSAPKPAPAPAPQVDPFTGEPLEAATPEAAYVHNVF